MSVFGPRDPGYEERVRGSFARQGFMKTLGAEMGLVDPGAVDVVLPHGDHLGQQHGFLHGGVVAALADTACGYAAMTLVEPGATVLTVEFKVDLLRPAEGDRFVAHGRVIKNGRTLIVCHCDVFADERHIATMAATMMAVRDRGISD